MAVTITSSNGEGIKSLISKVETLRSKAVYVGIPAETNSTVDGEELNLATLAMILHRGGTIKAKNGKALAFGKGKTWFFRKSVYIPPRPFIEQVIKENGEKYVNTFAKYLKDGFDPAKTMELLAIMAQGDVQMAMIEEGKWKENSSLTIAIKGSSKPLIDTWKLRQSVRGIVK